jgi:hypothetical protein
VTQRINNGGYGLGYIFGAMRSLPFDATTETPAITPLLVFILVSISVLAAIIYL